MTTLVVGDEQLGVDVQFFLHVILLLRFGVLALPVLFRHEATTGHGVFCDRF